MSTTWHSTSHHSPFAPSAQPSRWLPGGVALCLTALSIVLNLRGYYLVHLTGAPCPPTDIWRGILLAVASLGTVAPAVVCGLAGSVSRDADRRVAVLGLAASLGFLVMFYVLWA